jgi:phosphoribosyl 1,2-cyclic phosphate phosphodiesterase
MKITFLGTGTSQGVPVIACECQICQSKDLKDNRLRSSVLVQTDTTSVAIDSGADFRQQMLRAKVNRLDAVVFTHEHKDHVAGMDDVRAFNYKHKKDMKVFATESVQYALKREFHYIFAANTHAGIPKVLLHTIDAESNFEIGDIPFQSIEVLHYKLPVLGYRIKDFVYITDASSIDDEQKKKIKGCKVLVLNALRKEKHIAHFNLEEAISLANDLEAEEVYFTHISHFMGLHEEVSKELPTHMHLAYDGLEIEI